MLKRLYAPVLLDFRTPPSLSLGREPILFVCSFLSLVSCVETGASRFEARRYTSLVSSLQATTAEEPLLRGLGEGHHRMSKAIRPLGRDGDCAGCARQG